MYGGNELRGERNGVKDRFTHWSSRTVPKKKIFGSTLTFGSTQEQLNIIVFTHAAMQKTEQCSGLFFFFTFS